MPSLEDPSLRVALVHDWLTGMRGGEKVLEQLCEIFPEAPIHTLFHFPGTVDESIESHPILTSFLQRAPAIERRYRSYLPLFPLAIQRFDLRRFDLIISTSHCVAKGVKAGPTGVHVCYCHTPMRYAWDQKAVYFPPKGPAGWPRDLVLAALRRWDARSSARVDTFVANSTFVRDRIRRYYGRDASVIPPPVDVGFFTPGGAQSQTPEDGAPRTGSEAAGEDPSGRSPYALMVAALSPYKRLDLAVRACSELDLELRIVGTGPEQSRLESSINGSTRLLGKVEPEALRDLYRNAACLLQPGVEDFGIASVEALACGCPVVALDQGGVRDIVRDGKHGFLYEGETNVANLTGAVDKTLRMKFNRLNLRQRAERFSKSGFTQRMRSLLQRLVASSENLG